MASSENVIFYLSDKYALPLRTLVKRAQHGGRKGRSAVRRLERLGWTVEQAQLYVETGVC